MKQISITYLKAFSFYYISCLVCSLLFSLFYYFEIINYEIFYYGNYSISVILLCLSSIYIIKRIEKKKLLYLCMFIAILFFFTIVYTFGNFSFIQFIIKLCIALLVGLLFLFRIK